MADQRTLVAMINSKATVLALAALLGGMALFAVGCGEKDPGPSAETQKQSDRLSQIQQSSGGDWNKMSQADKDYMINELGQGSEAKAKMLLGPPAKGTPGQVPGR